MTKDQVLKFLYPKDKTRFTVIAYGTNDVKYIWVLYFDKNLKPIDVLTQTINSCSSPLKKPYRLFKGDPGSFDDVRKPLLAME